MKRCIINFANNRGNYLKGQQRLAQSLIKIGSTVDIFFCQNEQSIGSPLHKDNPYAFKVYLFEKALSMGYTSILYVDASVWAVKPLCPIWDCVDRLGYMKQYAGQLVGEWANDRSLAYFGITRDEAMGMEMHGNGGFFALDFEKEIAKEFFKRWKNAMLNGMFKGAWTNANNSESNDPRCKGHRHDMTCGSIIANQLGMVAYTPHRYMAYVGGGYNEPPESAVMYAQGI